MWQRTWEKSNQVKIIHHAHEAVSGLFLEWIEGANIYNLQQKVFVNIDTMEQLNDLLTRAIWKQKVKFSVFRNNQKVWTKAIKITLDFPETNSNISFIIQGWNWSRGKQCQNFFKQQKYKDTGTLLYECKVFLKILHGTGENFHGDDPSFEISLHMRWSKLYVVLPMAK